ncbi:MAG: flagellar hook-basal body protein [Planctomycetota bacterium]
MELAFHVAQNGLHAAGFRQGLIANNLANLTTDGYKAELADQATLRGQGTRIDNTASDLSVGSPRQTGIPQHMYIAGEGFFQVQIDGETGYTRLGNFHLDQDGNLVTPAGYLLEPNISVPEDSQGFGVSPDGIVYSIAPDGTSAELGQIQLARFVNPNGLESIGDNLYIRTTNSGDAQLETPGQAGVGLLHQSMLESSNVDPSTEITQQLINQRYTQLNLRVFQTADALVSRALDMFG